MPLRAGTTHPKTKTSGKILAGGFLLFAALALFLLFNITLHTDNNNAPGHSRQYLDLLDIHETPCFSPNGDGSKDEMLLDISFKGKAHQRVYAFLFIKKDNRMIRLLATETAFPAQSRATVSFRWDGRDFHQQVVPDGRYQWLLYCFNTPALFNARGHKPEKAYSKMLTALLKHKKDQFIWTWDGKVRVDTLPPELTITTPAPGLETTEATLQTTGTAENGALLTIAGTPVPRGDHFWFKSTLTLVPGPNWFLYQLEDDAGNRTSQTLSITRLLSYPPPTATLQVQPATIESGQSATLTWNTTGADTMTIDNGIGTVPPTGSLVVSPTSTTTYILTATGRGGQITAAATVTITNPPPVVSLAVSPATILEGGSATLTWTSAHADTLTIDNGIGDVAPAGSRTITPSETTTYTLSAAGPGGTATAQATLAVTIDTRLYTAIYGRVFHADTLAPLADALVSAAGRETLSNSDGYWQLSFPAGRLFKITITRDGFTTVNRKITLATGQEGTVDHAYLTPHDPLVTPVGPAGGSVANSDGTVQLDIPAGALASEIPVRVTRFQHSRALPGPLNATARLDYPIGFLFCANFEPDGTTFLVPATLRVRNTWGFAPGTQIPYAYWNRETQLWVPESGLARVEQSGIWLEATLRHFSDCDINTPRSFGGGKPDFHLDPFPDDDECDIGSTVNVSTGALKTNFAVPGLTTRAGATALEFIYSSKTAHPMEFMRLSRYTHSNLVDPPLYSSVKVTSPLFVANGGGTGSGGGVNPSRATLAAKAGINPNAPVTLHFNASPYGGGTTGGGALAFGGSFPSGRSAGTGYQSIGLSRSNLYPGQYYTTAGWGGLPITNTGVDSPEPVDITEESQEKIFMVSRETSPYGRGWWLAGLQSLHFQDQRVVLIDGDGSFRAYEPGLNYADTSRGALLLSASHNLVNPGSMLWPVVVQKARELSPTHFYQISTLPGTEQSFVIDLGEEREIHRIGLDFPPFWNALSVWDRVQISTSTDNLQWSTWSSHGYPTLDRPGSATADPLDAKLQAPLFADGEPRVMRYIRFALGFPSVNTEHPGSAIFRVYAIGGTDRFHRVDEEPWPLLEYLPLQQQYTLTDFSGDITTFDTTGRMLSRQDRRGDKITYQYQENQLVKILYPGNAFMELAYSNGTLSAVTDSTGRETRLVRDDSGQITEVIYPDASRREFDYDDRGLLTMDKKGEAVKTYEWNQDWPVLEKVTLPNGGTRTLVAAVLKYLLNPLAVQDSGSVTPVDFPLEQHDDGFDSQVTFEGGRVVTYRVGKGWKSVTEGDRLRESLTYANPEQNERPVTITAAPDGSALTTIHYTPDLQVETVVTRTTDINWQKVSTTANSPWKPSTTPRQITSASTTYTYNPQRLLATVKGLDTDISYTYTPLGDLFQSINLKLNKTTTYTHDDNHNLIRIDTPDGKATRMTYDANGLLWETYNNDNTKTTLTRNPRGEIQTVTDEENRTVRLERDLMGRVIKEISPGNRVVQYVWGGSGCATCGGSADQLARIIDPDNKVWQFKYDLMGNAIEMIYPDDSRILQQYDVSGNMVLFTNKRGQDIRYQYDDYDRLVQKITAEGTVDFTYDIKDRVVDVSAPAYHYTYLYGHPGDGNNSTIVQQTHVNTGAWSQHVTNPHGLPTDYYDSFQWHKNIMYTFSGATGTPIGFTPDKIFYYTGSSTSTSYNMVNTYDAAGRPTSRRNAYLDLMTYFSYDTNGQLSALRYRNAPYNAGFPDLDLNFTRDTSGLITGISGDQLLSVNYNADLEIETVNHALPQNFGESYTYDARGNRLTSFNQTYLYNDLNQLISSSTHNYNYDADGNLLEEQNTTTGEIKRYHYSSENHLLGYQHFPAGSALPDISATYTYDLYGRRLQKNVNGTTTHFFWEEDNLAMELDANFQPLRRYVYGAGMDTAEGYVEFSEVTGTLFDVSKRGWYSFVKEQVGTIYKVFSNYTEQMVDTRAYDTFGNLVSRTGNSAGNLGFQGKYYDQESGLYYFYHRYYHPVNGRFLNEDPIGLSDNFNMYAFVGNEPVNNVDMFGLGNSFEFKCKGFTIRIDTHDGKVKHAHWNKKKGSSGCITVNGKPCDGSGKIPPQVEECLKNRRFFDPTYNCDKICEPSKKALYVLGGIILFKIIMTIVGGCTAGPFGAAAGATL